MRINCKDLCSAFTIGGLLLSSLAQASGVLTHSPGARQAAMGGAFIGQSDDAFAIFYNPAGLALLGMNSLDRRQGNAMMAVTHTQVSDTPTLVDTERDFFSGVVGGGTGDASGGYALALGVTETRSIRAWVPGLDNPLVETLTTSETAFGLAYAWQYVSVGVGLSLVYEEGDIIRFDHAVPAKNDSHKLGTQWGLLLMPLDGYLDVFNTSIHGKLTIGSIYKQGLDEKLKYRFYTDAKHYSQRTYSYTFRPETFGAGVHSSLGVLTSSLSLELRTNADLVREDWQEIMPLLTPTPSDSQSLVTEIRALGAELLVIPFESQLILAFRSGLAKRTDNQNNRYAYSERSLGFGVDYKGYQLNLSHQLREHAHAAQSESNDESLTLTLGVVF